MAKEALQINSFTKEARPTTGKLKSKSGFGTGTFGTAQFGASSGYEQDKESLQSNSQTEEALPSKIY